MPPISARDEAAEWFIFATMMDLTMEDERSGRELQGLHNLDERQVKREAQGRRYDQIILDAFSVLQMLYSQRYLGDRTLRILKPKQGPLYFTLHEWKINHPVTFRRLLRVEPATFDALVTALEDHAVFANDSTNAQVDISEQIAITLYRLGHFGNGSSIVETGIWSGRGAGTVDLITRRVLTAICDARFRGITLHVPTEEEKEHSRQWVQEKTCADWRNGWCSVDGSGIGLYARPAHYGSNWFDRKCNYSANVQVSFTF
jgi:hypothetical protein